MKKIYSAITLFIALLTFTACCDNDNSGNVNKQDITAEADYTVIFWAMLGAHDEAVMADLGDMINLRKSGQLGKNVNFVGLVKTSPHSDFHPTALQDTLAQYGLEGTQYIELPENPTVDLPSLEYEGDNVPTASTELMVRVYKAFNPKKYAGTDYPFDNADSLAAFIKQTAKTHPAKHYVLMLLGHGTGFNPTEEVANPAGYTTRSCVKDEYSGKGLTADNIVAGVNTSGVHIQTLFFQNCLQSTLENLAAYQHCADYAVVAAEVTTSKYLQKYIANISQAGDDLEKMKAAARKTIDYYADVINPTNDTYTTQGFWDLSKVNDILGTVANVSNWYSNAIDQDESYINSSVLNALQITDYTMNMGMGGIDSETMLKSRDDFYRLINDKSSFTNADSIAKMATCMRYICSALSLYGFSFSYLMYATLKQGNPTTLDLTTLQSYYNTYMQQVKEAAYIRANYEVKAVADYDYLLLSPSINIFSMNTDGYHLPGIITLGSGRDAKLQEFIQAAINNDPKNEDLYVELFDGNIFPVYAPLSTVLTNYEASQFDKQCHWSNFLKKLKINPNYITNPSRKDVNKILTK